MKRIKRNVEKFEVIDLFTALSREHGYQLHVEEDVDAFMSRILNALKVSQNNDTLIHGKRIETLFKHLAAGLGACRLIKAEDAGETITKIEDEIIPPDYKLILNDGKQIFVEVKNCNLPNSKSPFLLRKDYVEKIERYGELHGIPVYYAIYYRCLNKWVMLPKSSMIELKNKYSTTLPHSMANNEMSMLGDMMIGTKPELIFELIADQNKSISIDEKDNAKFIIGDVKIYCENVEIDIPEEKNIAFYLIRFGNWDCSEPVAIMHEGKLHSVQFTFKPDSSEIAEKQGFDFIGDLSSMITSAFNEQTVYEQKVTSIDTRMEPDVFSASISQEYKGEQLPLWLFSVEPNPNFTE